jgi:hypothetical protein
MRWLVDVLLLSDTATVHTPYRKYRVDLYTVPARSAWITEKTPSTETTCSMYLRFSSRRARGKVAVGGPSGSVPCPAYPFMNRVRLLLGEKGCLPPLPPWTVSDFPYAATGR